ncbi:hypothetical protein [Granulicella sibirica]|uniref:Uncharacterized protein n=1 Tax=Granulicella sibirica TaxID=2479048 RepID=A0A4Q0SZS5_9BACT|nr:hypothetical protein [Granulicella sibirica]RXH56795.1 hypothetical protein GRAN_0105 [Granulicella sibirica]
MADQARLDEMQSKYKAAVDEWVTAIRQEESLASVCHDEAQIDEWEAADNTEEQARSNAKAAKEEYEGALREEIFGF